MQTIIRSIILASLSTGLCALSHHTPLRVLHETLRSQVPAAVLNTSTQTQTLQAIRQVDDALSPAATKNPQIHAIAAQVRKLATAITALIKQHGTVKAKRLAFSKLARTQYPAILKAAAGSAVEAPIKTFLKALSTFVPTAVITTSRNWRGMLKKGLGLAGIAALIGLWLKRDTIKTQAGVAAVQQLGAALGLSSKKKEGATSVAEAVKQMTGSAVQSTEPRDQRVEMAAHMVRAAAQAPVQPSQPAAPLSTAAQQAVTDATAAVATRLTGTEITADALAGTTGTVDTLARIAATVAQERLSQPAAAAPSAPTEPAQPLLSAGTNRTLVSAVNRWRANKRLDPVTPSASLATAVRQTVAALPEVGARQILGDERFEQVAGASVERQRAAAEAERNALKATAEAQRKAAEHAARLTALRAQEETARAAAIAAPTTRRAENQQTPPPTAPTRDSRPQSLPIIPEEAEAADDDDIAEDGDIQESQAAAPAMAPVVPVDDNLARIALEQEKLEAERQQLQQAAVDAALAQQQATATLNAQRGYIGRTADTITGGRRLELNDLAAAEQELSAARAALDALNKKFEKIDDSEEQQKKVFTQEQLIPARNAFRTAREKKRRAQEAYNTQLRENPDFISRGLLGAIDLSARAAGGISSMASSAYNRVRGPQRAAPETIKLENETPAATHEAGPQASSGWFSRWW